MNSNRGGTVSLSPTVGVIFQTFVVLPPIVYGCFFSGLQMLAESQQVSLAQSGEVRQQDVLFDHGGAVLITNNSMMWGERNF